MSSHLASVGKYTYGHQNIKILKWQPSDYKLTIGNFCSIANNIEVYLGGEHRTNWTTTYPFGLINQHVFNTFNGVGAETSKGSVTIGNDVWIGANVTIMSGITIGDGAVIANSSHVVKNVEKFSIVGGNPAKHIRYRFTPEQIAKLEEIKWWFWEDEKINRFVPLLCSDNIDAFIEAASRDIKEIPVIQGTKET